MDQQEFNIFYQQTHSLLHGYVLRLCGDPCLSEDIVQESYLRFLEKPPRQGLFPVQKAYLYTIAIHKLTDHLRKEKRWNEKERLMPYESEPTILPAFREERDPAIQTALDKLSRHDKTLLWLAYVEGYGHREIGKIMKLNTGSIRVLLFRARQRFRKLLTGDSKR